MKESMMRNLVFVNTLMNKLLIIPMFFLTMCGTAPVTPPAQACSPRLDGKPTQLWRGFCSLTERTNQRRD